MLTSHVQVEAARLGRQRDGPRFVVGGGAGLIIQHTDQSECHYLRVIAKH